MIRIVAITLSLCGMLWTPNSAIAADAVMDHGHIPIAVPESASVPALSLALDKDPMSGFNLQLILERYHLGPPPVGLSMTELMGPGELGPMGYLEGHAHLYVNGQKIQRLYGTQVHIAGSLLRDGSNEITVTLNNHGHMYWSVAGQQVLATLFLESDQAPHVRYQYASFPAGTGELQPAVAAAGSSLR